MGSIPAYLDEDAEPMRCPCYHQFTCQILLDNDLMSRLEEHFALLMYFSGDVCI